MSKLQIFLDKGNVTFNNNKQKRFLFLFLTSLRCLCYWKVEAFLLETRGQCSDVMQSKMVARGKFKSKISSVYYYYYSTAWKYLPIRHAVKRRLYRSVLPRIHRGGTNSSTSSRTDVTERRGKQDAIYRGEETIEANFFCLKVFPCRLLLHVKFLCSSPVYIARH